MGPCVPRRRKSVAHQLAEICRASPVGSHQPGLNELASGHPRATCQNKERLALGSPLDSRQVLPYYPEGHASAGFL